MKVQVSYEVEVSTAEASFLRSMAEHPQFWSQSIGYAMKGTAPVRAALVARGLVRTERRPVVNGGGEKYVHGELTELGRAVADAVVAFAEGVEV